MKRFLLLCLTLTLLSPAAFATCNPQTSETACKGELCEQLGATNIDIGGENIIACLNDGGEKRWKSMSSGDEGSSGCMVPNFPDVIRCVDTASSDADLYLYIGTKWDANHSNIPNGVSYAYLFSNGNAGQGGGNAELDFHQNGNYQWNSAPLASYGCIGKSIATLRSEGNTYCIARKF